MIVIFLKLFTLIICSETREKLDWKVTMKKISTVYSLVFVIHVFMYGNCAYAGFGFLKPLLKPIVEMCGKKSFQGW